MIKFENVVTPSPEQWRSVIMGARNPMNSWEKSDSFCNPRIDDCTVCSDRGKCAYIFEQDGKPYRSNIGSNDLDLMIRLRNAGTDHRKFMRMLTVIVTITAPLYWWKEYDTYKVATVANSCSTMHKIHAKEFTLEDFSHEHLEEASERQLYSVILLMNYWRTVYLNGGMVDGLTEDGCPIVWDKKDKRAWWQMIQLLPSSYNQRRTVMLNYEVLANIYKSRKNHKLDEWREFCKWIKTLPYSELITGDEEHEV